MIDTPNTLFSFAEPDHLIRIHVRLELENAGFRVAEEGVDLTIVEDTPVAVPMPMPMRMPMPLRMR